MGTNFYFKQKENITGEGIHIGKSSGGWCFSLHVLPEMGINTLDDWKRYFAIEGSTIVDEYGVIHSVEEMLDRIENRGWNHRTTEEDIKNNAFMSSYKNLADFYERNHAIEGPNNLLRHKVDGSHCVGNGEGTWDYIQGEFC